MTIKLENVIGHEIRDSRVNTQNNKTTIVQTENKSISKQQEKLSLPEIKLHLDDILKETEIKYTLDEKENSFIIKVMDKKTDTVIKEIPSHDIQVLRKHLRNHLGVLFNELI